MVSSHALAILKLELSAVMAVLNTKDFANWRLHEGNFREGAAARVVIRDEDALRSARCASGR